MCTGIQVKTENGAPIYGRTMEFADDLQSEALVIPKGTSFTAAGPFFEKTGIHWTSKYDITGLNAHGLQRIIDGINSVGLSVGAFYFIGYAGYMDVNQNDVERSMCSTDLPTYLLSTCKTVEEVKRALLEVKVNKGAHTKSPNAMVQEDKKVHASSSPVPLHYNIHDADGNVLVVEYIEGELHMHDNPIGVLTNSPDYKWHYTNLKNYINLTPFNKDPQILKNTIDADKMLEIKPTGQGSGFFGIPGDYTPPSRFIRAVAYSQHATPMKHNEDAVLQAFHILNAFDIPLGTVRQREIHGGPSLEYTQWTVASDLKEQKFYFHTTGDRTIRMIDLANWKFTSTDIVIINIDQRPTIHNMAHSIKIDVPIS